MKFARRIVAEAGDRTDRFHGRKASHQPDHRAQDAKFGAAVAIVGVVRITDEAGSAREFGPGESALEDRYIVLFSDGDDNSSLYYTRDDAVDEAHFEYTTYLEEGLFTKEFYGSCFRALKDDGIMVYQHGSPFFDEDEAAFCSMHRKVFQSFPISRVYQAHIPTCPSGYWMFGFASKKYHPINDFDPQRWKKREIKTQYYTSNLHLGAFMLPKYVEDLLIKAEDAGGKAN